VPHDGDAGPRPRGGLRPRAGARGRPGPAAPAVAAGRDLPRALGRRHADRRRRRGAAALRRISERLRAAFDLLPGAEVAIELDPRATDGELLDALAGIGVTRASLGVQSLDPAVQEAVNRVQPLPLVAATAAGLRERGIRDLNVDLLYGLPRQTAESAAESARLVAGLEPARVAVFGYAHVPELMKRQRVIDAASLPDAAQRAAQQEAVAEVLLGAGYVAVGLDHFARPDDPLAVAASRGTLRRNFQGYTTDAAETLIGLGCSSISTFAQGYVQNHADLARWREAVAGGRLPTARGVALRPEDRLRREVIEAIMCRGEVDLAEVAARHGAPPSACEPDPERFALVARHGVAAREGSVVRVGPAHRPLLRIVAAAFDVRLRPSGGRYAAAAV
jgi:oxygen-independent coproporphyrinogen III oxidase